MCGVAIAAVEPVAGGCISSGCRVRLKDGDDVFVKWRADGSGMFETEASSLAVLHAAGAIRVPAVIGRGSEWLALEWLEPVARGAGYAAQLAEGLVALHRVRGPGWGWEHDNFIGALPQPNGWLATWPEFWRERRLRPQAERAYALLGNTAAAQVDALFGMLDALLEPAAAEGPSLLHGDLWHGNVLSTHAGPALIDPACSYGHREVDLAMAALFGGLPSGWEHSYDAAAPLRAGATRRRAIYQLYYLLVHVNLFGAGYASAARATLQRALYG
jgi:protein-ribulosamine 3-kinase